MADDDVGARAVVEEQESYTRSWLAIGLATVLTAISYGSLLIAMVSSQSDDPDAAGPAFALGFALVPITYVVLAYVSGHHRAPIAVLKAMALWLLIALPLGLVNPVLGLSAAYGAGGVVALRRRDTDRWQTRAWAVVLVALYSFGLVLIFPPLAVLTGGLAPIAVLGIADYYNENRAKKAAAATG